LTGPNRVEARDRYRRLAPTYDRLSRLADGLRHRAVAKLDLKPGETVIDVACGTGLTFALIERRIGPQGRLIGIDLSPEMLEGAAARVADNGWDNVSLIEGSVDAVEIPAVADAAAFILTHDVMRTPAAVRNVVDHVRPGGRVAVTGPKRAPRWAVPVNAAMSRIASRYVTTDEGFERPWEHLADLVPGLQVKSHLLGGAYVAWGEVQR
jgi:ubiquinone/menaquinone biosynthesis C-methylase UbiE